MGGSDPRSRLGLELVEDLQGLRAQGGVGGQVVLAGELAGREVELQVAQLAVLDFASELQEAGRATRRRRAPGEGESASRPPPKTISPPIQIHMISGETSRRNCAGGGC